MWLKDPTPQNKEQYKSARDAFKQVIKHASFFIDVNIQWKELRKIETIRFNKI